MSAPASIFPGIKYIIKKLHTHLNTSLQSLSIRWFLVEGPTMKLPLPSPLALTKTFSSPWSTRIRDDHRPSFPTALLNSSKTVCERLLLLHFKNMIRLEKPSMHACTTRPQRMREWCTSKCHKEFGHGTEYCLRERTIPHPKALF